IVSQFNHSLLRSGRTGVQAIDNLGGQFKADFIRKQFRNAVPKWVNGKFFDLSGFYKIRFADSVDVNAVVQAYKALKIVLDAQPIGRHAVYGMPNDPQFSKQWHLNRADDHDVDAPEAWDIETGNDQIIVALMDTGVRYFHKDLGGADASYDHPENANGNMWINWTEKNGTAGVDDDGNGYVDDWIGWDFVDNASSVYSGEDGDVPDNDPRDFNGHGTHCAGNVGALNNNGTGLNSVSGGWGNGSASTTGNGVKVMALRIGYSEQVVIFELGVVQMDWVAEAFYYAADNGARIASCSWGTSNDGGVADALDYFMAHGGLVFHAAGNDNNENSSYFDDRGDIISVAATDSTDNAADFTTYGTWVDISAPGTGIWSTAHNHDDPANDYIQSMDGTSMATPICASVGALVWSLHPDWTAEQVKQRLYDTADNIEDNLNATHKGKMGAGRVNAYNAVYSGTVPPVADFSASPLTGCAPLTVSFTDQSTGDITSWSWDFGDGGSSTDQNPSYEYTTAGTFTVALTVTGPGGSDTATKTDYITVGEAPVADFNADQTSGSCPLTVTYTDASTGNPTTWSWSFPGGDPASATGQGPHSVTYNNGGNFSVTLDVSNDCGSNSNTKTDYISVTCGILGDVNADDAANSTDALIILSCDVGQDVSQYCPMNCGDVNSDGLVNSTDALIILSYDVGMSVSYPVGQPGCPGSVTPCAGCNP
ncbi:MAG: S8 family serine peptidase, partial [Actinobacteria bacterium]|nr:S8 family serine peptidase [Actinomycetota bacterium]